MKKRFLGLFLVFALLFACVPGMAAQAAGADLSANVKASEFRFLTDGTATAVLTPGKTVTAECKLERTATGTNAQNYCFLLQVIDNGKLIDLKKTTGSISVADGKKTISVTSAELGADTSKYEVIALLVSDMETMTPLAMPANFKNSTCEIASITVAGNKLPLEAGKTDYSMNLSVMEDDLPPAIEVVPYDLSTSITVNNISGTSGTATVTAVSHDGTATAQYNIALNITALTPASLKSVTVDGTPLANFDPSTLTYRIHPTTDAVPVIAFETALASTTAAVTAATELPGTTVVKTHAADGSEQTYKFQFTKTVEVTAFKAAEHHRDTMMGIGDATSDFVYNPTDYDVNNRILNMKDWKNSNSKAYFAFRPNLPIDAVVEKAEMTLMLQGIDKENKYNGTLTYDVFENTDTSWTDKAQGQYTEMAAPAYASTAAGTTLSIPAYTKPSLGTFAPAVTTIKPDVIEGKQIVSFTGIINQGSPWNVYAMLSMQSGELPKLKITYYREDSAAKGQVAAVFVGGKRLAEFDPDTYEYVIKTDVGATEVPEIIYTLANGTTATYTPAVELPGTATIATSGGYTYRFKMAKTEQISASMIGNSRYSKAEMLVEEAGKCDDVQFLNYGTIGRMLLTNWDGTYTGATSYAYFYFNTTVPENCTVTDASVSLVAGGLNLSGDGDESVHLDLFENTDSDWVTDASKYAIAYSVPTISENKINKNDVDIPADATNSNKLIYRNYTYQIQPISISGKTGYSICALARETNAEYKKFSEISVRQGEEPKLTITYYKD